MSQEFWVGFLAGGVFASLITMATGAVRALWAKRRDSKGVEW